MSALASFEDVTTDLQQILSVERELLLSGRAAETAQLTQEKLGALDALETWMGAHEARSVSQGQRSRIEAIAQLARENTIHFSAVRNGLRNAITRLQGSSSDAYVGAYRLDGAKTPFSKATGSYEKKV